MITTRIGIIGLVIAAVSSSPAIGATLFETNFEPPVYTTGPFIGQDAWFAALGGNAASVSTELAHSPTQSVRIDGTMLEPLDGFNFGSYARPLSFDPVGSGLPIVTVSGWVNLMCDLFCPTCGTGLGLTGLGDALPNALIGIQVDGSGHLTPYLSNADASAVFGPTYILGQWAELTAVFNYQSRTVTGFVNGVLMGEVFFTTGASSQIAFLNMSLGSSVPGPGLIAYNDDFLVTAAAVPEPSTLSLACLALLGLAISYSRLRRCGIGS